MHVRIAGLSWLLGLICLHPASVSAAEAEVRINDLMSPPTWALLERQLLATSSLACEEFFERFFDERGYLLCVERWGGDDGPDDAIENCNDWPTLHALGGSKRVLSMVRKAWEGHLRQYTEAKTIEVPFARDGMYYKEFPVMFDWQHNGEGLGVFNLLGLSDPGARSWWQRTRRYAGFYMNEDPGAPNYDPQHKIIRSMINGSRGPLMRKATGLDWTGDPIEVEHRFDLGHGERSYEEMLAHFKDYNDVVGDHPLNLLSTTLALNAYMLSHQPKYREWLLGYVDAWHQRMVKNQNIIPSNIGLDGTIGGECDGKWYGGTYGWGFSVVVPQTGGLAHRNRTYWSFVGFMNAYLLTGDDKYLDVWRKQTDAINAQKKVVDGIAMYPRMYGDQGWYHFVPQPYQYNALELYYLSMRQSDRLRVPVTPWLSYLDGKNAAYPETALRADLSLVRDKIAAMRDDATTPDTRLSDDSMKYNPAQVSSLIQLMLGGIHVERRASVLHCRLRYFDPVLRRAGLPDDVAALVDHLSADEVAVTLVNTSQLHDRELVMQAGGYAEHHFQQVDWGNETVQVNAPQVTVRLAAGSGARLRIKMQRYANQPTTSFPWQR